MSTRPYLLLAVLVLAGCASPPPPSTGKNAYYDYYYANQGLVLPSPAKPKATSVAPVPSPPFPTSGVEQKALDRAAQIYSGPDRKARQAAYAQAYYEIYGKSAPSYPGGPWLHPVP